MQENNFLSKIFNSMAKHSVLKIFFAAFFWILVVFSLPSSLFAANGLSGAYNLLLLNSDITSLDTDEDGMDDKWELDHGLNPQLDDANEDLDGDGLINVLEYYFDNHGLLSDPNDINSTPPTGSYYIYDEHGRRIKLIRVK